MTVLEWDKTGERIFEIGVDRGVLYIDDRAGIAWTGLISVSDTPSGGEVSSYYMDGVRYLNVAASEEFGATIEAFTYPEEFDQCDGTASIQNGLLGTQQPKKHFGLVYRTKVGNDVDGSDYAYKIHIVYNALAAPSPRDYNTIGESIEPTTFSWDITTLPVLIPGQKPTSHFVIDSRKVAVGFITYLEEVLYGNEYKTSRLPAFQELVVLFSNQELYVGSHTEPYSGTWDSGVVPTLQTETIDGGTP